MSKTTIYERLGGYDAISAVANDRLPRLQADSQLARFCRSEDGLRREKQLLIDYLCSSAGGPLYYTGRDMKTSHKGMKISERDYAWASLGLATALRALVGYERAAEIALTAHRTGDTVRAVAEREGVASPEELDRVLDPARHV